MRKTNSGYRKTNRAYNENSGFIKRAVLRQIAVCSAIFALFFIFSDTFFAKDTNSYKLVGLILTENTDFKEKWEEAKSFFKEQVKVTNLLTSETDLDPVRNMTAPVNGTVFQKFGLKTNTDGTEEFCYGVKLKTENGAKVFSAQNGEVAETGTHGEWGNYILIKHSEKIYTFYAHLEEILPVSGEKVKSGQVIGKSGKGELYFELRDGDSTLDPEAFIEFKNDGEGTK